MIASSNPVEIPCNPGKPYVENVTSINSLYLVFFPSGHELVRDDIDLVTIEEDVSKVI